MEPNVAQLNMIVKCSDALSMPLPEVTPAGAAGLLQAAWYNEDRMTHVYATVDRLGIITAVWVTALDRDGWLTTESNPSGIVDIFQAHHLPLGANVVGQASAGDLQLELSEEDALSLIYALQQAHNLAGRMHGTRDALTMLAAQPGMESFATMAEEGTLLEALAGTQAWEDLATMYGYDQQFMVMVRRAAQEVAPFAGPVRHDLPEDAPAEVSA